MINVEKIVSQLDGIGKKIPQVSDITDEDINAIYPRVRGDERNLTKPQFFQAVHDRIASGPSWVGTAPDGTVIGMGGIVLVREGVGWAWTVITDEINNYKAWSTYIVKKKSEDIMKEHKLWRVEAECYKDFEKGRKWFKTLGFKEEGIMRKYGLNGEDYVRVAKVK